MNPTLTYKLGVIIIFAVALRITYQAAMLSYGGSVHNGSDSEKYLNIADSLYTYSEFSYVERSADGVTLTPATDRMPIYPYFLVGLFKVFGYYDLESVAIFQILVDSITIIGISLTALSISPRLVVPSALVAAFIPNFIVHSSYILTETLFLMFFTWGLCAALWALQSKHRLWLLVASGILFSMSLYTRQVMMFFPIFLYPALIYGLRTSGINKKSHCAILASVPVLIMIAAAAPRVIENHDNYGHAVLTTQSGNHMLKWVYPCLRTPWSCSSHGLAWQENSPIVANKMQAITPREAQNPVITDMIMRDIAMARIRELGFYQIAAGLVTGATKNLIQTGIYETFSQFRQPTTFFSAMPGHTVREQFLNFLSINRDNYFMIFWVFAQIALLISRFLQFVGLAHGLRDPLIRPKVVILLMTVVYFLIVNGPIANPKYRIPMEPALIILFAIGVCAIFDWIRRRTLQTRCTAV